MRPLVFISSLLLFLCLLMPCTAFSVLTFNIWTGGKKKETAILNILKKSKADIMIINEANEPEVFENMADNLGYFRVLSEKNKYNVGIMSKYPIESFECLHFDELSKSLVHATIKIEGELVHVFACHLVALDTNKRRKKRLVEMDIILNEMEKYKGQKMILAGDMNEVSHLDRFVGQDSVSHKIEDFGLMDTFRAVHPCAEVAPGFSHNILMIPTKRIDYIYASAHFDVKNSKNLGKLFYRPWPSDHSALISTFAFKKKEIVSNESKVIDEKEKPELANEKPKTEKAPSKEIVIPAPIQSSSR